VPGLILMFCAPGLVFDNFHFSRSRTRLGQYQGRQVPISCFALQYSISTVPRVSGPVCIFCASGLIFGCIEGVEFRFYVLRFRFRRYRGRHISFSYFTLPNLLLAVPRASDLFFMFYVAGLDLGATEHVISLFHVLRSGTRFRRYRGRQIPFSCFTLPDSFTTVPKASTPVFMFRDPGLF
jgi:hypothetical protein